jgi:hypothetical protein
MSRRGDEVAGHARQPGAVRRQVQQGDLPAVARGHAHAVGEILLHGIVQRHLAPGHHVGQDGARERLVDGADLEHRLPSQRARAFAGGAVGEDARGAVRLQDADDDPRRLPVLHEVTQHRLEVRVRRKERRAGRRLRPRGRLRARLRRDGGGEHGQRDGAAEEGGEASHMRSVCEGDCGSLAVQEGQDPCRVRASASTVCPTAACAGAERGSLLPRCVRLWESMRGSAHAPWFCGTATPARNRRRKAAQPQRADGRTAPLCYTGYPRSIFLALRRAGEHRPWRMPTANVPTRRTPWRTWTRR